MTPATRRAKPTDGALRAAKEIERNPSFIESIAEVIDRETGVRELVEILEKIIAEAGDLIESRSPELVAQATLRFGITAMNRAGKKNDARFPEPSAESLSDLQKNAQSRTRRVSVDVGGDPNASTCTYKGTPEREPFTRRTNPTPSVRTLHRAR